MYTIQETMQIAGKLAGSYGRYLDYETQEDIKQDVALAMIEAGKKADQEGNVRAYQFTTGKGIVQNLVSKAIKYNHRFLLTLNVDANPNNPESDTEMVDLIEGKDTGYVQGTIETERASAIESAIASLPTVQATLVRRTLQEGATLETAGQEQGFSKERARQVLSDAKETLAFRLKDWEATVY